MKSLKLLTIDELSAILDISKTTIYQHTCKRSIPFYKIGKRLRFKLDDVLMFYSTNSDYDVQDDFTATSLNESCSLKTENQQQIGHLEDPFK